jgi:DNA-binding XRE family transcriptional regulator
MRKNRNRFHAEDLAIQAFATQMRVARAALSWSQTELGRRVGLSQRAVHQLETGDVAPRKSTEASILEAFADKGIRFMPRADHGFEMILSGSLFSSGKGRRRRS